MNGFRLVRGYADFRDADGGPVAYIGDLRRWDHILKDTIYATQENLGSAAAVHKHLVHDLLLILTFVQRFTERGRCGHSIGGWL